MFVKDFLIEIGVEELPASFILPTIGFIEDFFCDELRKANLKFGEINSFSTPRRLALRITDLQMKQEDTIIEKIGPSTKAAFTENGDLSKAGSGFIAGAGAKKEQIIIKTTPKGEYISLLIENKGKKAEEILKTITHEMFVKIKFPKSMRWAEHKESFARPTKWLIMMIGNDLVDYSVNNLQSDFYSYGNRYLSDNKCRISQPSDYEKILNSVKVIANRNQRKEDIRKQLSQLFENKDEEVLEDEKLLDVVTDLVEFPTACIANFDGKYLSLPEKIITATLTQNQKCFAVINKTSGKLVNKFVFISNGNPEFTELIKSGNEKVIVPRLEDAEFYYNEDIKKPLENYYEKLNEVLFQKDLGTIKEKTDRIVRISTFLADLLKLEDKAKQEIIRTALLCKCDLVTLMLGEKEFTKLQGYIGKNYALAAGENKEIAEGIYEHYMPRGQNDSLPITMNGSVVAIADKIDTICGIIGVGLVPTGSNDPFAIRRAANGVVQIISANKFDVDLFALIEYSLKILGNKIKDIEKSRQIIYDFMKQRINWLIQQNNIDYDVIESVMHIDYKNIPDVMQRAFDVQSFKSNPDFIKLVLGFKRVSNILQQAEVLNEINDKLLQENEEKLLFDELSLLKINVEDKLISKDYHNVMQDLVNYSSFIDLFFDKVLVNTEETELRNNRYALLSEIRKLFLKVADLSKIVIE
ncbi:MAG: glycine--tRNA ligase subunit beta [Candidatus Cloacimonetes bacterium]|nr:glycine--tRNA ligase subunit beta [Candidatus Cloacimonadota bacterium]